MTCASVACASFKFRTGIRLPLASAAVNAVGAAACELDWAICAAADQTICFLSRRPATELPSNMPSSALTFSFIVCAAATAPPCLPLALALTR